MGGHTSKMALKWHLLFCVQRKMILQYPAMETIVHLAANEREFREREQWEKTQNGARGKDVKSGFVWLDFLVYVKRLWNNVRC